VLPHKTRNNRFSIITLGCPKNLIDSERLAAVLVKNGWRLCKSPKNCDIVVLNTCAFIPPAREEAFEQFKCLKEKKRNGEFRFLVLAGCLPLYHRANPNALLRSFDLIITPPNYQNAHTLFQALLSNSFPESSFAEIKETPDDSERLILTAPHYGYLRISDGCSNRCSYCTIPYIRGNHRPKPASMVLAEAEALAACGVKELIVIAQDTTAYKASDTGENLPSLLGNLVQIRGLRWIRLMYTHPAKITPELVNVLAEEKKIVHYIDLPIQHINERILKLMGRAGGKRAIMKAIESLRSSIPDIAIRTSLIVGFPTETEDEFKELLEFVGETRFERLGAFSYEREPNTKSSKLPQLPTALVKERLDRLMQLQKKIAFSYTKSLIGKTEEVILDNAYRYGYIARTYRDAPQIDSLCKIRTTEKDRKSLRPKIGELINVRFVSASGYDIIAQPI